MSTYAMLRGKENLGRLAAAGLDLPSFWQEASTILARAVPHYSTP